MDGGQGAAQVRTASLADLAYLVRRAAPARWPLALAALLALVEVAGTLAFPLLTRGIVDTLGRAGPLAYAALRDPRVYALVAVLLASAAAASTSRYITAVSGLRIVARLKTLLFEALIAAPVAYFDASASGDHTSRIMNDTKALSQLVSREVLNAFAAVLLLAGAAVVLFSLDTALAAILFGVIGFAFLVTLPVIVTLSGVTFHVQETTAALSARLTQVFAEIRLVKAFGSEARERREAQADVDRLFALGRRSARIESALNPVTTLAVTFSLVTILAYGGTRVAAGTLSSGTLTAVLLYIFTVVGPLAQLASFFSQLATARGGSVRIAQVLRQAPERDARTSGTIPSVTAGSGPQPLRLDGVRFSYGDTGGPTLDIDRLHIPAGRRTAIIGASGSGKSTILALIERFYAPDRGAVRYGGRDIAEFDLAAWRARIGYVAQAPAMMTGTLRSNLLYGIDRPVDARAIDEALRLAHCADFVARLPNGLESQVGERGFRLSGGERQRIAIARMFLRDPEILLLDEATAHLDEAAARLVLAGLESLMRGRTTILVTHRLAGIEEMDQIIVIDGGRVVGAGGHHELLQASPAYQRVVNRTLQLDAHA